MFLWVFQFFLLNFPSRSFFPLLPGWGSYGRSRDFHTYCGFDFDDNGLVAKSYFIFVMVVVFVIPVCVTAVSFSCILSELQRTAQDTKRKYGKGKIHKEYSDGVLYYIFKPDTMSGFCFSTLSKGTAKPNPGPTSSSSVLFSQNSPDLMRCT